MRLPILLGLLCVAGGAAAFKGEVHAAITEQAGKRSGYDSGAVKLLRKGNLDTDEGKLFETDYAHFDNEKFAAGSKRLRDKLQSTIANLARKNRNGALLDVGTVLHGIQDFFAHSNFVELGRLDRRIDILNLKDPPKGLVCVPGKFAKELTSGYWTDGHKGEGKQVPDKCMHSHLNKDGPAAGARHTKARMRALEESGAYLKRVDQEIRKSFRQPESVIRFLKDAKAPAPNVARK